MGYASIMTIGNRAKARNATIRGRVRRGLEWLQCLLGQMIRLTWL